MDASGSLWLIINVGFVALLALGLFYGIMRSRRSTPQELSAGDRRAAQLSKQADPDEAPAENKPDRRAG